MDGYHLGLVFAALSAVFNGTFGAVTKLPQAQFVPPLVINYWIAEGVGLSGMLLLAVPPRVFSAWGLLSGTLFVASAANAVISISLIGVSAATGVWCGVAVLCSFTWGVLVAGDNVADIQLALLALALILVGIAGIAAAAWAGSIEGEDGGVAGVEGMGENLLEGGEMSREWALEAQTWRQRLCPRTRALLGLLAAVLAGAIGGLVLAPMLAAPSEVRGIQFVPSMALGALLVAPVSTLALTCTQHVTFIEATSSHAAGPGMIAGAIWNVGNVCCIAAVTNPKIGLAVAMPIMQCGLFVAGFWGIFLYKEIQGARALVAYWTSGAVLVVGAGLLATAKQG